MPAVILRMMKPVSEEHCGASVDQMDDSNKNIILFIFETSINDFYYGYIEVLAYKIVYF